MLCLRVALLAALAWVAAFATLAAGASAQSPKSIERPAFALVDQRGQPVDAARLGDKPSVVFFGFTRCPVICPTTLYEFAGRIKDLGSDAAAINFVFVSIDPERDTPAFLGEYLSSFDDRILGLTGDKGEVAKLASALGAVYAKVPTSDGDYTMDHSVNAFVVGADWRSVMPLYVGDGANEAKVVEILRALAHGRPIAGLR